MPTTRQGIVNVLVTSTRSRLEIEEMIRRVLLESDLPDVTVELVRSESLSMPLGGPLVVRSPSLPGD